MRKRWMFGLLFIPVGIVAFGYLVMCLWNGLVPELFHGPVLNYWQAIGLLVLSKIFFGGFRGGCGGWRHHHRGGHWRKRFEEKLAKMTPEEREKFRQNCNKRWCGPWEEDSNPEQAAENK